MMWFRLRSDQGTVTSEFVITTPILIGFLCLVILTGRLTDARSDVIGAANDAARVASLQATAGAAHTEAQLAAQDGVAGEGLDCSGGGPTVDVEFLPDGRFARGNTVFVTVTCVVDTSDLALLNLPGSITIDAEAWEPIDEHRSLS